MGSKQTQERDWIRYLEELLIVKNLSPEQAAPFIGVSNITLRRWIKREFKPSPPYLRTLIEGIQKIEERVADRFTMNEDGTAGYAWGPSEFPEPTKEQKKAKKEEEQFNRKLKVFFTELAKRTDPVERELILYAGDYWTGFKEIRALAKKYNLDIPM